MLYANWPYLQLCLFCLQLLLGLSSQLQTHHGKVKSESVLDMHARQFQVHPYSIKWQHGQHMT